MLREDSAGGRLRLFNPHDRYLDCQVVGQVYDTNPVRFRSIKGKTYDGG